MNNNNNNNTNHHPHRNHINQYQASHHHHSQITPIIIDGKFDRLINRINDTYIDNKQHLNYYLNLTANSRIRNRNKVQTTSIGSIRTTPSTSTLTPTPTSRPWSYPPLVCIDFDDTIFPTTPCYIPYNKQWMNPSDELMTKYGFTANLFLNKMVTLFNEQKKYPNINIVTSANEDWIHYGALKQNKTIFNQKLNGFIKTFYGSKINIYSVLDHYKKDKQIYDGIGYQTKSVLMNALYHHWFTPKIIKWAANHGEKLKIISIGDSKNEFDSALTAIYQYKKQNGIHHDYHPFELYRIKFQRHHDLNIIIKQLMWTIFNIEPIVNQNYKKDFVLTVNKIH